MPLQEEIKQMQQQGLSDSEIYQSLRKRGFPDKDISASLSQAQIKQAVSSSEQDYDAPQNQEQGPVTQEYDQMQPSMMPPQNQEQTQGQYQQEAYYPQQTQQTQQTQYESYAPYQQLSSDTITEISEQVISEKLSPIKEALESAIDLKNSISQKLQYIEQRITRIESIIDNLQSSILQKVGQSLNNISDLKQEIIETQKSFKALTNKKQD